MEASCLQFPTIIRAQAAAPYALSKKKLRVMGLQLHARRAMNRIAGAARSVATHAMRGIDAARPVYEAGRPALHHLGINTAIADKALNHYDGIRRALGR